MWRHRPDLAGIGLTRFVGSPGIGATVIICRQAWLWNLSPGSATARHAGQCEAEPRRPRRLRGPRTWRRSHEAQWSCDSKGCGDFTGCGHPICCGHPISWRSHCLLRLHGLGFGDPADCCDSMFCVGPLGCGDIVGCGGPTCCGEYMGCGDPMACGDPVGYNSESRVAAIPRGVVMPWV